jgi:hypothetical protein
MKLAPYEVKVPEGRESEGYVYLRHNTQYTIVLSNQAPTPCDAKVQIDGREVGLWRVPALKSMVVERPVHETGRLTFYEVGSREAQKAGISESDQLGLLTVIFTPEKHEPRGGGQMMSAPADQWAGETLYMAPPASSKKRGHAGGTGLSGKSDQEFRDADPIEYDESKAVTIHLRLVGEPDEPRPMFQRETAVPPPVAPRDAKRSSNNPANSQQDDVSVNGSPEQMQETKRRIRHEIHDEVIADRKTKKRSQSDRLTRLQYLVVLLILILGMSFLVLALGSRLEFGLLLTAFSLIQIPLLWMRLADAGLKSWIALFAVYPYLGLILGITGIVLPTKDV